VQPTVYKFAALRKRQALFVDALITAGFSGSRVTRQNVVLTAASLGYPDSFPWPSWLTANLERREARGLFFLPELAERVMERAELGTLPKGFVHDVNNPGYMVKNSMPGLDQRLS
jgi:hypothetical protein